MATDKNFRDQLATVKDGKRVWVYPKKPKGKLTNARTIVAAVLLTVLFSLPFVKVNGNPFVLINILDREFYLFGIHFWPQDFHLMVFGLVSFIVFIVLFTVVFGRVFCGWICPQTIFMEMVFRKIEYLIEGDANKQKKLNKQAWNQEKIIKKTIKQTLFYMVSFLIANTFLSYIIGYEELSKLVTDGPVAHWQSLVALLLFTTAFYLVFSKFREQVCVSVCPYGRLQGVLLDSNSIVVSYDFNRGEPRGKRKKNVEQELGDCIDCKLCVQVCPTGIDIRNGTQLECVNCTVCIDECDTVMTKIGKPTGLIRYASHNELMTGERKVFSTRTIGYSFVLLLLLSITFGMFFLRNPIETTFLRAPGSLYTKTTDGKITNQYQVQIVNKTDKAMDVDVKLKDVKGNIIINGNQTGEPWHLGAGKVGEKTIMITLPKSELKPGSFPIDVEIYNKGKLLEEVETKFMAPFSFKK